MTVLWARILFPPLEAKMEDSVLGFVAMGNLLNAHTHILYTDKHTHTASRSKGRLTAIRVQRCSLLSPTTIEIYKELERDYEFITLIHK